MTDPKQTPEVHNRQFTGVWIPAEIFEDDRLTWFEKCLWAQIKSFNSKGKPCTASNRYLADECGTSPQTVVNAICSLRKCGFINDVGDKDKREIFAIFTPYGVEGGGKPRGLGVQTQGFRGVNPGVYANSSITIGTEYSKSTLRKGSECPHEEMRFRLNLLLERDPMKEPWGNDEEHYLIEVASRPNALEELDRIENLYHTVSKNKLPRSICALLMAWPKTNDRAKHPENERGFDEPKSRNEGTYNTGKGYGEIVRKQNERMLAELKDVRRSGT